MFSPLVIHIWCRTVSGCGCVTRSAGELQVPAQCDGLSEAWIGAFLGHVIADGNERRCFEDCEITGPSMILSAQLPILTSSRKRVHSVQVRSTMDYTDWLRLARPQVVVLEAVLADAEVDGISCERRASGSSSRWCTEYCMS